jgi:hypothetical protein
MVKKKGKAISFFKAYEKKREANSAHNETRNITGPFKMRALDQGLKQQGAIAIQLSPVFRQALSCERKNFARKTADRNVRQNRQIMLITEKQSKSTMRFIQGSAKTFALLPGIEMAVSDCGIQTVSM